MTTVAHLLEIAGARPILRACDVAIEDLEIELPKAPTTEPRIRLLELGACESARMDFGAIARLRARLLAVLRQERIALRLRAGTTLCLEVSGKPSPLSSASAALRARAALGTSACVLEVDVPARDDASTVSPLATWTELLDDSTPAGRRHVWRAPPQPACAAEIAQEEINLLLADSDRFFDSERVGLAIAGKLTHSNAKMVTSRARRRGSIFGAWDGNAYRYPVFQFDVDGKPRKYVSALVNALPRDADGSGRDAVLWLFTPDATLDGRSPADVFCEDPNQVIALARSRQDCDHQVE